MTGTTALPALPGGPAHWVPGYLGADVASADRVLLDAGADLMSVAAAALAHACAARLREVRGRVTGARVVLLVGSGNNGGDALLAGALLRGRGAGVTALLCADRHHEPGVRALRRAGGLAVGVPDGPDDRLPDAVTTSLAAADLVVDGLLGIGARGSPRGAGGRVLAALGGRGSGAGAAVLRRPPSVIACDLPSGLDPGTGAVHGPVLAADVTVTFGAAKAGLLLPPAQPLVGRLHVVDLGLGPHLPGAPEVHRLTTDPPGPAGPAGGPSALLRDAWPWAWRRADKYSRGVLGVAAGEAAYPGAAVLVALAAVTAGAGMVRLVPPADGPDVARLVLGSVPEVVVQDLDAVGRVQAWVVGPGTSGADDDRADHVLTRADEPAVVDAGALTLLARARADGRLHRPDRLLLTPHAGELDRLLDALGLDPADPADRLPAARAVAAATGATVLLKGSDTLVVAPDGTALVVPGGPSALATAGAGDVLAGLAGTLLAAGIVPPAAGVLAAHAHALAGARAGGRGPLRASAVAHAVAQVLAGAHPDAWDHG